MTSRSSEPRFICDRMAGSLCKFLRLLGYDTLNANDLPLGNLKEDTTLLRNAEKENRILLTRDAELSRRDQNLVRYLSGERLDDQIRQLVRTGLVKPDLRLTRCSVCNNQLVPVSATTLSKYLNENPDIFPGSSSDDEKITWCRHCKKAYWEGSHTRKMREQIHQICFLSDD